MNYRIEEISRREIYLYIVFLSVLVYVGLDFISITVIASIMILSQWYFSDRIVLWSSGAKKVTREQFPKLHDVVERIIARNNLPKLLENYISQ
jgi:heat shock protein HtpX